MMYPGCSVRLRQLVKSLICPVLALLFMGTSCGETELIDAESVSGLDPHMLPVWSPGNTWILFGYSEGAEIGGDSLYELFAVSSDGATLLKTSRPFSGDLLHAAYSPSISADGSRVAFGTYRIEKEYPFGATRSYEISSSSFDGSDYQNLTNHEAKDLEPAWSHDGKRVAFVSDRGGTHWSVFLMASDGTDARMLTPPSLSVVDDPPLWSPDGRHVAFLVEEGQSTQLYTIATDGSDLARIPSMSMLAWSPDGARIAFVVQEGNTSRIYSAHADGSDAQEVTEPPEGSSFLYAETQRSVYSQVSNLSWSPDGSEIRLVGWRDSLKYAPSIFGIHAVRVDGSGFRTIAELGQRTLIAFSPDDSKIAIRDDVLNPTYPNVVLYTLDANGSNARALVWEDKGRLVTSAAAMREPTLDSPLFNEGLWIPRPTPTATPPPPPAA